MIVSFPILKTKSEILLVIFAKEPVPGVVKTRLSPPLHFTEAAAVYRLT
jgi:glycosyltransferase A (GT-A) superfamily protein (DUF2064 family)